MNIASSQELDNQKELKLLEQQAKELESQLSPVPVDSIYTTILTHNLLKEST